MILTGNHLQTLSLTPGFSFYQFLNFFIVYRYGIHYKAPSSYITNVMTGDFRKLNHTLDYSVLALVYALHLTHTYFFALQAFASGNMPRTHSISRRGYTCNPCV